MTDGRQKQKILTYNALKGLGSIGILFSHMSYLADSDNPFWKSFHAVFMSKGSMCCSLFVLFSGFFLCYSWGEGKTLKRYAIDKLKRLYPLTFIIFVMALLVDLLMSGNDIVSEGVSTGSGLWFFNILANITLIKAFIPVKAVFYSFHGPSWYISVLFWFYIMAYPFLKGLHSDDREKWLKRVKIICAMAYMVELAICIMVSLMHADGLWLCYVNPWFRIFGEGFAGILLCVYMDRFSDRIKNHNFAEIMGITAFLLAFLIKNIHVNIVRAWIQIVPMAFLLIVFRKEEGIVSKVLSKRPFQFIGNISFELYMTHAFVYEGVPVAVGIVSRELRDKLIYNAGTRFVITFILCIIVAYIAHIFMGMINRRIIYKK